jgi:hypothetical protein
VDERCELLYGFVHCVGRTLYHTGFADSDAAAERWVRKQIDGTPEHLVVPEADPVRWCPVRHCHMKRQKPWFGYRSADGRLTICSAGTR